jgi:phosphoenolpyruvate carboxykinase (ATP)
MITAALNGELDNVEYDKTPFFRLAIPKTCPNVPDEILNARNTWADKNAFDEKAAALAAAFVKNFEQYASGVSKEVLDAAPIVSVNA